MSPEPLNSETIALEPTFFPSPLSSCKQPATELNKLPPDEAEDPTSTAFKVSLITYNVSSSSICGAMVPVTSDGISVPGAPIRSTMYSLSSSAFMMFTAPSSVPM
eukprot:Gb_27304 [translate_table: standard]